MTSYRLLKRPDTFSGHAVVVATVLIQSHPYELAASIHLNLKVNRTQYLVEPLKPGIAAESMGGARGGYADFVAGSLLSLPRRHSRTSQIGPQRRCGYSTFWGAADLPFAFYEGQRVILDSGSLGLGSTS